MMGHFHPAFPHLISNFFSNAFSDYIRYWHGSIHTYRSKSAPVILVASHSKNAGKKVDEDMAFLTPAHTQLHLCTYI